MIHILLIGGAGYIGSYLHREFARKNIKVDICDIGLRGFPHGAPLFQKPYEDLSVEELAPYSHIVWFAGHSSVTSAINDPYGALYNNCLNLVRLREKAPAQARLIYASSASLYSTAQQDMASDLPLARESDALYANLNAYDMSKFVFDYIAKGFLKNFSGLRLGTVSGWSPNLRRELLFNAMNLSAQEKGKVMVANPQASRSILFLDDLFEAVWACVRLRQLEDGFYNLASTTATVGEFGQAIASHYGAQLELMPPSLTYSFRLDTGKAQEELGITFRGDLDQRCQQFLSQLQGDQPVSSKTLVA